ncbi:hypothetical protein GJU39_00170 [Pedobacter petrophilus]|uniref:ATP-grasp domain-containing protein n=1 Tax=Pedobacter petrophilus TaxID=1908241 RepID=A0A7K0FUR1_9SPHI|nr:hypothetical protein [Pedobacter petrophilus]MRX74486.1 hypothetical protein [Pedobacter petrophilus]
MILVLSYGSFEQGTDPVIDWLLHYKADFLKLTTKDLYTQDTDFSIDFLDKKMIIKGNDYFPKIKSVWCRRFSEKVDFVKYNQWPYTQSIYELNREQDSFQDAMYDLLSEKKWLMNPRLGSINKINVQARAHAIGLKTPQTIVTNSREELRKFHHRNGAVITKPIEFSGFFRAGSQTFATYTTTMDLDMIDKLPLNFNYSFFQQKVAAHYEVRTFYLDGQFYSSAAVFDSTDRPADIKMNYSEDFLHWVNYQLPETVENKLRTLMDSVGLNTGSIDLLRSHDGEYYFLEVNPGGQYSAPSERNNLNVEKHIAEWLINNDR